MTEAEMLVALAKACEEKGSQTAFAKDVGVTQSFLSKVARGARAPSAEVLTALGLRRVVLVTYEPLNGESDGPAGRNPPEEPGPERPGGE